jgi:hypothetical protein
MSVTNNRTPFPGHGMLIGPETYTLGRGPGGDHLLKDRDDYILWHRMVVAGRKGQTWKSPEPTVVLVNHGKWQAQCHWCKKFMLTRPDWNLACCSECGAYYEDAQLVFPDDPLIVEALLARPDRDTQHWDCLQSADDLIKENKEILKL